MKILKIGLFFSTIACFSIACGIFVYSNTYYPDYDYENIDHSKVSVFAHDVLAIYNELPEISDKEWKAKVNRVVGIWAYAEIRGEPNANGRAYVPFRIINVRERLHGHTYAGVLLHELVHINYLKTNERETSFLAFKIAWESDDPYLQAVAVMSIMSGVPVNPDNYTIYGRAAHYLGLYEEITI